MNKKILIAGGVIVFGLAVALFATGSFGELTSLAIRPRVVPPSSDLSYLSCKSYTSDGETDSMVYLSSSKKTYTNIGGENIDISEAVNRSYFGKQVLSVGQPDPKKLQYTISYTSSEVNLQTNLYVNGKSFQCPAVIIAKFDTPQSDMPDCTQLIANIEPEVGKIMKCIGPRTFTVEMGVENQILSWMSNLLGELIPKTLAYTLTTTPSTTEMPASTTEVPSSTNNIPSTTEESYTTVPPETTNKGKSKIVYKYVCANGNSNDTAPKPCGCKNGFNSSRGNPVEQGNGDYEILVTTTCRTDLLKPKIRVGVIEIPPGKTCDERGRDNTGCNPLGGGAGLGIRINF